MGILTKQGASIMGSDLKKPWESKTLWVNLAMALAAFFPAIQQHVNIETVGGIFGAVNFILRLTTKTGVSLK